MSSLWWKKVKDDFGSEYIFLHRHGQFNEPIAIFDKFDINRLLIEWYDLDDSDSFSQIDKYEELLKEKLKDNDTNRRI